MEWGQTVVNYFYYYYYYCQNEFILIEILIKPKKHIISMIRIRRGFNQFKLCNQPYQLYEILLYFLNFYLNLWRLHSLISYHSRELITDNFHLCFLFDFMELRLRTERKTCHRHRLLIFTALCSWLLIFVTNHKLKSAITVYWFWK